MSSVQSAVEVDSVVRKLMNNRPCFNEEQGLAERLTVLRKEFRQRYNEWPTVHVRVPGRAEILGNHTDYNNGFALSCAIPRNTLVLMSPQNTGKVVCASASYSKDVPVEINLNQAITAGSPRWADYPKAIISELLKLGKNPRGANILDSTTIPSGGGVSTSAAFEVALALGLSKLGNKSLSAWDLASLCKRAENGPIVGVGCGILDQISVLYPKSGEILAIDFQARTPGSAIKVSALSNVALEVGLAFVVTVDPKVKRELGQSGYPERAATCKASLPIISEIIGKDISSLREIRENDLEDILPELTRVGPAKMANRVEHVVRENARVLAGIKALQENEYGDFGSIMTDSGESALKLYDLADKTPELTFLYEATNQSPGVLGSRNMGGGFSAITLSLVEKSAIAAMQEEVGAKYKAKFGNDLQFLEFSPASGGEILE